MKKHWKAVSALVAAALLSGVTAPSVMAESKAAEEDAYNKRIIEDEVIGAADRTYWDQKGIRGQDKNYVFKKDSVVTIDPNDESMDLIFQDYKIGAIMWNGYDPGSIDMTGHKLTLNMESTDNATIVQSGIRVDSEELTIKNANGIDINLHDINPGGAGIYVYGNNSQGASYHNGDGNASLVIENDNDPAHAVKIRFTGTNGSGIFADKNTGTAKVDIKGLVDIETTGRGINAIKGAEVSVGGGRIVGGQSFYSFNSQILVNSKLNESGSIEATSNVRDVVLEGNIQVVAEEGKTADVAVSLNTKGSHFKGGIVEDVGKAHVLLSDGAYWTNSGTASLHEFAGGKYIENTGYIIQNSDTPLAINNYKGFTTVIYSHSGDGTAAENYKGGNTTIAQAAEGSGIVLSTDNTGIKTSDTAQVKKVLGALAQKLMYSAYAGGERNLTGQVQIADGLTASSAAQWLGNIKFDEKTGQGQYDGGEPKPVKNQTVSEFNTAVTGVSGTDKAYVDGGVLQEDGTYKFRKDTTITVSDGPAAVNAQKSLTLDARGRVLSLATTGTSDTVYGVNHGIGGASSITAQKLNVAVVNSNGRAEGIHLGGGAEKAALAIEGEANVTVDGTSNTVGAYVTTNGELTVNGNLSMKKDGGWGIEGHGGGWGYYGASGLYATSNMQNTKGGTITVNGLVDMKVNGNGIVANAGGSQVAVDGGSIEVNRDNKNGYAALRAEDGIVNMNVTRDAKGNVTGAGDHAVNIKGNVAVTTGAVNSVDEHGTLTQVNLGLTTKDSSLEGVIYNAFPKEGIKAGEKTFKGESNLWLQNGASWGNAAYGVTGGSSGGNAFAGSRVTNFSGGADNDHRGYIVQKDSNPLTIDNYSGHTTVIYAHEGSGTALADYKGGDTVIEKAAAGSGMILSTDKTNIDVNNTEQVNQVLSALAQKLTYSAYATGERNLTGQVQIASGLTSSSLGQIYELDKITFNDKTGKGSYVAPDIPKNQTETNFTTPLTGVKTNDKQYLLAGVLKTPGVYKFEKDSTITTNSEDGAINVQGAIDIDAEGKTLSLNVAGEGRTINGISQLTTNEAHIKAGQLNVSVTAEKSRAQGLGVGSQGAQADKSLKLTIDGNTSVNVKGNGYALGVYSAGNSELIINGNVSMKGKNGAQWGVDNDDTSMTGDAAHYSISGLYAGSSYSIQKGAHLTVNGDVDLAINGTGILANGGSSQVDINGGGTILIAKNDKAAHYAIDAESATANMNVVKDQSGTVTGASDHKVNITGNLGVTNGAVNANEPQKKSIINLGLSTKDSMWTGVAVKNFTEQNEKDGFTGQINLYMSNGATWANEVYGKTPVGGKVFDGSYVEKFVGGADAAHQAYIIQKDTNPITIRDYSGFSTVFYAHEEDGTKTENYRGGDTVIFRAARNSGITLSTDNKGITLADQDQVNEVLTALAQKITYKRGVGFSGAKVQIASGLTGSSMGQVYAGGNIEFDLVTGKGSYVKPDKPSEGQTTTDFTTTITGVKETDTAYTDGGVLQADGTYKFTKDSTINVAKGSAVDLSKDAAAEVKLDAAGKTLSFTSTGDTISPGKKKLTITAEQVNIKAESKGRGEGLDIRGDGTAAGGASVTINGNTNIISSGSGYALGVYTNGGGTATFNGNVSMKNADGSWGLTFGGGGLGGTGAYYSASGLYAGSVYSNNGNGGGHIIVNGDVDLKVDGTGAFANGDNSSVDINGGGTIEIKENDEAVHFSLLVQSGHVNMNVIKDEKGDVTGVGDKKVNLIGNIGTAAGSVHSSEPNEKSILNLGLTTADSTFTGLSYNAFPKDGLKKGDKTFTGTINLWLQNGATWTNKQWGMTPKGSYGGSDFTGSVVTNFHGGSDAAHAGVIFQEEKSALNIYNYSGFTKVLYAHTGDGTTAENYAAGDTIIDKSEKGSQINLITDNKGITMSDKDMVAKVLNALAGKLTYSDYASAKDNLKGFVQISSGLTASAQALETGKITFDDKTGKGGYEADTPTPPETPDHQVTTEFTTAITGVKEKDTAYVNGGVLKNNGTYQFEKNSDITIASGKPGIDMTGLEAPVIINAADSTLNLKSSGTEGTASGLDSALQLTGSELKVTANKLNVTLDSKNTKANQSVGIRLGLMDQANQKGTLTVKGDTSITANGSGTVMGTYIVSGSRAVFDGNLSVKVNNASAADGKLAHYFTNGLYAGFGDASITVGGDVDIEVNGTGVQANKDSVIDINGGGTVKIAKNDKSDHYSLIAEASVVNMNTAKDKKGAVTGAGTKSVKISGNLGVLNKDAGQSPNTGDNQSVINLGLSTKDSILNGIALNEFAEQNKTGGQINLYMSNGAVWTNESWGAAKEGFTGSHVTTLAGGTDAAHAGYIIQKDKGVLTVDKYSGHMVVVYDHANAGADVKDYTAGNTVIKSAETGSEIVLSTSNTGIQMDSKTAVEKTLSALAQKLTYEEAVKNTMAAASTEKLKGKVQIADGLTSSNKSLTVGDISFNKVNGQGGYVAGTLNPNPENPNKPEPPVVEGDYETDIMKGVRSAMTDSLMMWRDNASDMYETRRTADEDGIFAKAYGGRVKYDGNGLNTTNDYWGGQVGYDKVLSGGWHAGIAFDYQDGDAKYAMGGKGDDKLYSFGLYGAKDLGEAGYVAIAAKAGRIENDFRVYNIIGQELKGDYKSTGYSLSAQYGKRFGDDKGYLEPQLQLTWAHAGDKKYDGRSGTDVLRIDQKNYDSLIGRIGVEAGKASSKGSFYGRLSVAHEFSGDVESGYYAKDGGAKNTKFDGKDTWAEVTLGGQYKLSPTSQLYGDVTRSFGGDYEHEWEMNAGIRFSF